MFLMLLNILTWGKDMFLNCAVTLEICVSKYGYLGNGEPHSGKPRRELQPVISIEGDPKGGRCSGEIIRVA